MNNPNNHNRLFVELKGNQCNPKQDVTGSNPVTRSTPKIPQFLHERYDL
ncbi:MAG TPA: hypothetical protein G4O10_07530 [Dehalococcoidia bacterium]|nr:hypothetical protein [Dehalococcoidia bacterium]